MNNQESVTVRIPIPKEFIGKWCIVMERGTHGAYNILALDGMVFDSEEQARWYMKYKQIGVPYNDVCQIQEDYPVWQTRMFVCGFSVKDLKRAVKK